MFTAIVIFGVLVMLIAVAVVRRYEKIERSELSTYIVLISWGSLLLGLCIAGLPY